MFLLDCASFKDSWSEISSNHYMFLRAEDDANECYDVFSFRKYNTFLLIHNVAIPLFNAKHFVRNASFCAVEML